jgi:outer membrane protein OmpA-like peptidoglycan-associated protein
MKSTFVSFLTFLFLLGFTASEAKERELMKADFYYSHFRFKEAIPNYEKVADELNDPNVYAELGDCYRYIGDFTHAKPWYDKAIALPDCNDTIKLHYGQLLMILKKYQDALKIFKDIQANSTSDRRLANLITACNTADSVWNSKPKGDISFMNFNTNNSEFAPTFWKDKLVFTADYEVMPDKKANKIVTGIASNIYFVSCDKDGTCGKEMKKITLPNEDKKTQVGPATFSPDGKKMYVSRTKNDDKYYSKESVKSRGVVVPLEVLVASDFDTNGNKFNKVVPFQFNTKKYSVAHPTVSPDENMLVFSSDMPGGSGGSDLYYCLRKDDEEWTEPESLGEIVNTEGEEVFPFFADNETLYFSSNGLVGLGGLDIYYTKWNFKSKTFSKPVNVGIPINSSYDDISLALFPDGRSSYFSSNRPALKKGDNVFFFNRAHAYIKINVFDSVTSNPLSNMRMYIETSGDKRDVPVDKDGKFVAAFYPDIKNEITIVKRGYAIRKFVVNGAGIAENDTITQNISLVFLDPDKRVVKPVVEVMPKHEPEQQNRDSLYYTKQSLFLLSVTDSSTHKPLKGVLVTLSSEKDNRTLPVEKNGKLFTQLYPEILYTFTLNKPGYNTKELTLKTIFAHADADTFREKVAMSKGHRVKKTREEKLIAKKEKKEHKRHSAEGDDDNKHVQKHGLYKLDGYYFAYAKAEMVEDKNYLLDSLVMMLNEHPTMKIQINGHADCRGSASYNLRLSERRAQIVVNYLIKQGIEPKRLRFKGYGITRPKVKCPVCSECTEEQHVQNRGVEYEVLHM